MRKLANTSLRIAALAALTALLAAPSAAGQVADPGFESAGANQPTPWFASGTGLFPSAVCTVDAPGNCGTANQTVGPHGGVAWAWFGGTNDPQTQKLSQQVDFPIGTTTLNFSLWIGVRRGGGDETLSVTIDGTQVFTTTQNAPSYWNGYNGVSVPTAPFVSGTHTIEFTYTNPSPEPPPTDPFAQPPNVNMSVDDVSFGGAPTPPGGLTPAPGDGGAAAAAARAARPSIALFAKPHAKTKHTKARFQFVSNDPNAYFQCQIDNGHWFQCASAHDIHHVKPGKHVFEAVAIDPDGDRSDLLTVRWKVLKAKRKKGP